MKLENITFLTGVTFNLEQESTFSKKKYNMNKQNFDLTCLKL